MLIAGRTRNFVVYQNCAEFDNICGPLANVCYDVSTLNCMLNRTICDKLRYQSINISIALQFVSKNF